jgi:hypothetical protein
MRLRPVLAAAALAASAFAAVPAHAAVYPVCATTLVSAPAGFDARCDTNGPGQLGNRDVATTRYVVVQVDGGAVDATLDCDNGSVHKTITVSGPVPQTIFSYGGNSCSVTLHARVANTTAVATSFFSIQIILEKA